MYRLTILGFFGRWIFAAILVFASYNPTGYCYLTWALAGDISHNLGLKVLVGIVLGLLFSLYYQATMRSLGEWGVGLLLVAFASIIWQLSDWGWVRFDNPSLWTWFGLAVMSFIGALGMAWQHIQNRLTGQLDIDDD